MLCTLTVVHSKRQNTADIVGFEILSLLRFYAVSTGKQLHSGEESSGSVLDCFILKMKAQQSFEVSVTIYMA